MYCEYSSCQLCGSIKSQFKTSQPTPTPARHLKLTILSGFEKALQHLVILLFLRLETYDGVDSHFKQRSCLVHMIRIVFTELSE